MEAFAEYKIVVGTNEEFEIGEHLADLSRYSHDFPEI